jgi:CubicO group peptidase (beta-lactamase class C family)
MTELDSERLREGVGYADRWIGYQQQLQEIPGLVLAVRYRDNLLLCRGYGFADVERQIAMTPQHIFRIASHSKTFTATAIMQLVERGKLRLDDPLGAYIPWLRGGPAQATIRQALNHSAGVIRDGSDADFWQLDRPFPTATGLQGMAEEILPANDRFKYSNIGFSLLGLVIEAASGTPYNDYVSEHIVRRLDLPDTGPETHEGIQDRLVAGYPPRLPGLPQQPIPDVPTGAMSAATGFYSTAEDLCRYASAHFLGNEELLSDASKREMQQPYWEVDGTEGGHYGLGFSVGYVGKRRTVGHGGSFPGHATRTMFDPKDGLAVVVLTNRTGAPAEGLAQQVIKILDYALDGPPGVPDESVADLDRFTGRFGNLWGVTDIVRFGGRLVALAPNDPEPAKNATELEVVDGDTLRIGKTNGYGSPGETVRYSRSPDGTLTKIVFGGVTSYPDVAAGLVRRGDNARVSEVTADE